MERVPDLAHPAPEGAVAAPDVLDLCLDIRIWRVVPAQPQWIGPRERAVAHVPVQVDPAAVARRVPRQEASPRWVVVAVGEQDEIGLAVRILAPLAAKGKR